MSTGISILQIETEHPNNIRFHYNVVTSKFKIVINFLIIFHYMENLLKVLKTKIGKIQKWKCYKRYIWVPTYLDALFKIQIIIDKACLI